MRNSSIILKFVDLVGGMSFSKVALLSLILTVGYFFTVYDSGSEIQQSIEAAKTQSEEENTKKIQTNKILKKEQQMKEDVQQFAKKFEVIKSRIPIEFTESELREIVVQQASKNSLTNKVSSRTQLTFGKLEKDEENLIERVALNYTFEGTYVDISQFIVDISNLDKIVKIGDFTLTENASQTKDAKENKKLKKLNFVVTIIGFKQQVAVEKNDSKKATP